MNTKLSPINGQKALLRAPGPLKCISECIQGSIFDTNYRAPKHTPPRTITESSPYATVSAARLIVTFLIDEINAKVAFIGE